MLWKSTGDDQVRKYDFSYDGANRLTGADFNQFTNQAFNKDAGVDFSVSNLSYDSNGNILSMTQRGLKGAQSHTIDSLVYSYLPSSNRLKSVLDHRNDTATRLGDFRSSTAYMTSLGNNKTTAATDYTYDGNGNLVKDLNKDIMRGGGAGITYNHLNLPTQITTPRGTITYSYDAAGTKLQKVVAETGRPTKTTLYLAGAVYENDTLQFIGHEEGRIRTKSPNRLDTVYYDYFLKDHLGNVRMVLTEESTPAAVYQTGLELATRITDTLLFNNIPETASDKPPGFDSDGTNAKVAKLFSSSNSDKRVGPGVVLKVMAGDKFKARVQGSYLPNSTDAGTESGVAPIVNSLISAFTGGVSSSGIHEGSAQLVSNETLNPSLTDFLAYQNSTNPGATTPKAYLNWILLDEAQFKLVEGNYGAVRIPAITGTAQKQLLQANNGADIEVKKNGYLYVYLSNESKGSVYFDDLRVEHTRGPLLEETHYYPFGLSMSGISSKAAGKLENKKKYQEYELTTDFDINLYESFYRSHDPQLGRWWQVDPKANYWESPFAAMGNNPIINVDILGDTTINGQKYEPTTPESATMLSEVVVEAKTSPQIPVIPTQSATPQPEVIVTNGKAKSSNNGNLMAAAAIAAPNINVPAAVIATGLAFVGATTFGLIMYHNTSANYSPPANWGVVRDNTNYAPGPLILRTEENVDRNWKDDKKLSPGEIKKLKENGWDHSDKGKRGGQSDLYKDKDGNIYQKPKGGQAPGEPIGINIKDL